MNTHRLLTTFCAAVLVASAAFPGSAQAAPIFRFVATTGADSGDCSSSSCASIGYAISQAVAGDTIQVAAGIYTESGVTVDRNLAILGSGANDSIVQAAATPGTAGAGVFTINSGVTAIFQNLVIQNGNTAAGSGGGIENLGTLTLTDTSVRSNSAFSGGGIDTTTGTLTLNHSTVSANNASYGGGIQSSSGAVVIDGSTITGNTAVFYGGGLLDDGPVTLNESTISRNTSTSSYGGGVANNSGGVLTLNNSTVSGNSAAGSGGGISSNSGGVVYMNYSTIANNAADTDATSLDAMGGGVYTAAASSITFKSSIVLGNKVQTSNTTDGLADCYNGPTPTSNGYNLTGTGTGCGLSGTGDITTAPANAFTTVMGPLNANGGPTETHALRSGSPATDQVPFGTNGCGGVPFDADQKGLNRPQGSKCDIGADEAPVTLNLVSAAGADGWILESSETSGTGGTRNATSNKFYLGDDASNRQYRAILSFNTALVPDTATIVSATLKIRQSGQPVGTNPFSVLGNLWVDLHKGPFGTNALQLSDFNSAATTVKAGSFYRTPVGGWYTANLKQAVLGQINLTGPTQFRLYFGYDDNNNHAADYMKFLSGNYTSMQPLLVVRYTMP